jgi:hypothetical protein
MDMDTYTLEWVVKQRLDEARARTAADALLVSLRGDSRSVRSALGSRLTRLVHRFRDGRQASRRSSLSRPSLT